MKPAMTMITATVHLLIDPRACNLDEAGACDWISETLRDLEDCGLTDWGYEKEPCRIFVPVVYKEGDFLNPRRLDDEELP